MKTLLLPGPQSGTEETGFRSDRNIRISGSLAGTDLAGRYRISQTLNSVNFKAHDLVLDQTVTVREASVTSQRDRAIWRPKARQIALVRGIKVCDMKNLATEHCSRTLRKGGGEKVSYTAETRH